ncbi:MAG: PTS system mannose/fructose/sorbose family transporter subunit IID [Deltaproteobacteria bacterium]|nr:PTS system mannose/fructose/sorbose family transporter subunit IID [Deltaproteobacteria bacterium]
MIGRFTMFKVFLNSFFIQSAWSFEKMQGLGFAANLAPAIRDMYKKDNDKACAVLKRHMVFYNAHPYMASPILGAVIKMEEEVRDGIRDAKDISYFKQSLTGPYGAIGDTFFWGAIRPLASVLGVISALIWGLWGPVVFLIVYNIFHLWMRWFGLCNGYRLGEDVVDYIKSLELPERALRVRLITTVFLGILVAIIVFKWFKYSMVEGQPAQIYPIFLMAVFMVITTILLSGVLRKGISVSLAIYLLFIPAFVFLIVMNMFQRIG